MVLIAAMALLALRPQDLGSAGFVGGPATVLGVPPPYSLFLCWLRKRFQPGFRHTISSPANHISEQMA